MAHHIVTRVCSCTAFVLQFSAVIVCSPLVSLAHCAPSHVSVSSCVGFSFFFFFSFGRPTGFSPRGGGGLVSMTTIGRFTQMLLAPTRGRTRLWGAMMDWILVNRLGFSAARILNSATMSRTEVTGSLDFSTPASMFWTMV